METNLNRTISTPEEANDFTTELFNNGELFHYDDDVEECLEGIITPEEVKIVNELIDQMFSIENFDPFDKACDLIK
jgi:hypothetical protein